MSDSDTSKKGTSHIPARMRKSICDHYEKKLTERKKIGKSDWGLIAEVARDFDVSYDQAYNAIRGRTSTEAPAPDDKGYRRRPIDSTVDKQEADLFVLFEREYKATILQLSKDREIGANERAKILSNVADAMSKMQRVELEHHMKRTDALVVERLVKMYDPDATRMDVLKKYKEAEETVRIERSQE